MVANHNRVINYLRLSVTDRYNLRCVYCMPEEGVRFIPHSEVLTYEEMLYIVSLCVETGIKKVRVTGGEPLVRQGIVGFIERLNKIDGLERVALTTNGVLLKQFARDVRRTGMHHINVSMDTLKRERFECITRRDVFDRVRESIREAEALGFDPIKINVVAMKGIDDDEILDFARLTYDKPYHVRFIEMMPVGENHHWTERAFMSSGEILDCIRALGRIVPLESDPLDGPAHRYRLEGARGEIGFIGALSDHFCDRCNRLRLTACGQLRGCLFSDHEVDLKTPLRKGEGKGVLLGLIEHAILNKPGCHGGQVWSPRPCIRLMNSIGG